MDWIHPFLNIAVPPIMLVLYIMMSPIFLLYKLLSSIKRSIHSENVAGKVALVTGAASGIGEQLAYEYARRGASLVLVDISEDNLVKVSNKARSKGSPDVISIVANVSKVEDCKRFIDEAVNHFGRLDHLVNNAGIFKSGKFETINKISNHYSVMDVNFWGTVNCIHFAVPHLKKTKGKIIVISSVCGLNPLPALAIYCASKAALINLCETLRTEFGSTIGITVVTPGLINSKMTQDQEILKSIIPEESAEKCAKAIVRSACRGELYLTEPKWIWWQYPTKVMAPEVLDWMNRSLLKYIEHKSASKRK